MSRNNYRAKDEKVECKKCHLTLTRSLAYYFGFDLELKLCKDCKSKTDANFVEKIFITIAKRS